MLLCYIGPNEIYEEKKIKDSLAQYVAHLYLCPRKLMDKLSGFYPDLGGSNPPEGAVLVTQLRKSPNLSYNMEVLADVC